VAAVVIRLLVGPVREPATSRDKAQSANTDSSIIVLNILQSLSTRTLHSALSSRDDLGKTTLSQRLNSTRNS
jgi:hypothetical protein